MGGPGRGPQGDSCLCLVRAVASPRIADPAESGRRPQETLSYVRKSSRCVTVSGDDRVSVSQLGAGGHSGSGTRGGRHGCMGLRGAESTWFLPETTGPTLNLVPVPALHPRLPGTRSAHISLPVPGRVLAPESDLCTECLRAACVCTVSPTRGDSSNDGTSPRVCVTAEGRSVAGTTYDTRAW